MLCGRRGVAALAHVRRDADGRPAAEVLGFRWRRATRAEIVRSSTPKRFEIDLPPPCAGARDRRFLSRCRSAAGWTRRQSSARRRRSAGAIPRCVRSWSACRTWTSAAPPTSARFSSRSSASTACRSCASRSRITSASSKARTVSCGTSRCRAWTTCGRRAWRSARRCARGARGCCCPATGAIRCCSPRAISSIWRGEARGSRSGVICASTGAGSARKKPRVHARRFLPELARTYVPDVLRAPLKRLRRRWVEREPRPWFASRFVESARGAR